MTMHTSSELYQPDESTFLCGYRRVRRYGTTQSQSSPATPSSYIIYQVKSDDTLERIALKHNCSVSGIVRANKLWSSNALFMKEFIKIPIFQPQGISPTSQLPPASQTQKSTKLSTPNSDFQTANNSRVNSSVDGERSVKDILQRIDKNIKTFQNYEISSTSVVFDSDCN